MRQLGQITPMYVHHMRPAGACSPTHSLRAFLQFVARSDDGTRRTERTQVRKIQLHIVQHLVIGTSIQSPRRRPIANVRCCAECFRPRDFSMPKWWSIACSALASTLIVHSDAPLDAGWCGTGVQLGPLRSQMSRSLPSVIRACCPW